MRIPNQFSRRVKAAAMGAAVFFSACSIVPVTDAGRSVPLSILTWNCQTLFDEVNDGTEYEDFSPGSWTPDLYAKKLETVASVIRTCVSGGPDIVALQEIENIRVLRALADGDLKRLGYRYLAVTSVEGSALQVGIMSRIPITRSVSHGIAPRSGEGALRSILEGEFGIGDGRLILLVNHWKSKYGGDAGTEETRIRYAGVVSARCREILRTDPHADIVAVGDFNESADEYRLAGGAAQTALIPWDEDVPDAYEKGSLFLAPPSEFPLEEPVPGSMTLLAEPWMGCEFSGSYFYRDSWLTLDHTLLSPALFDGAGFEYGAFEVIRKPSMCTESGAPMRWNSDGGTGCSDHFPLLLTLRRKK